MYGSGSRGLGTSWALVVVIALTGCGGSEEAPDAGGGLSDGGGAGGPDAGTDAGPTTSDAGIDAGVDRCGDVICSASDRCHVSTCDPATGLCVEDDAPDGTVCADSDVCTEVSTCATGVCVAGGPVTDGTLCPCGECSAGACGLRVLGPTGAAPGTATPIAFAIDGTNAVIGNSYGGVTDEGSITTLPLAGGSPTAIATTFTGYPVLTVVGGTVYYTRGAEVWSVPVDGSAAPTSLYVGTGDHFTNITSDGAQLYLTDGSGGGVYGLPFTGGTPDPIATAEASPRDIVTDGTQLYWINASDGSIRAIPIGSGPPVTLTAGTAPRALAVDADAIYWTEPSGEVMRLTLATNMLTTIATGEADPLAIMRFGDRVYWTNYNGGVEGDIRSAPAVGGTVETVAGRPFAPNALAHDGTCIYILHAGNGSVSSAPAH